MHLSARATVLRTVVCALAAFALACALAAEAQATTFTVNTTADSSDANGCTSNPTCSLRDAIAAANAGSGGDTIVVPSGHFVLSAGNSPTELQISKSVTIAGAGARNTIVDAAGNSRVFNITTASLTVTIQGLTVTGGVATPTPGNGGGILDQYSTLHLSGVAVTGNTASLGGGGIFAPPPFESVIPPPAVVTLDNSTVANNKVVSTSPGNGQGGGMAVFGDLTITNSTITGNSIGNVGLDEGAAIVAAQGGAATMTPVLTLVNTTISANTITGGIVGSLGGGGVSGDNLPETQNQGQVQAQVHARNTIVSGNTFNGNRQDCSLVNTTSTDHNLSSDSTCGFGDPGSKQGTEPNLGQLQANGGSTDTEAIGPGSPALDAGTNAGCPATDQRGVLRPQLGTCDIGAFEFAPPIAVTYGSSAVTQTSAIVSGAATNPHVDPGSAFFQYGTTTAYGQSTAVQGLAAGAADVSQAASLTGLQPSTLYHFRLVAVNHDATSVGADATFTSSAVPHAPVIRTAGVRSRCAASPFTFQVRVTVAKTTRLRSVRVTLDGRQILRTTRTTSSVRIDTNRLRAGAHTIRTTATDALGHASTTTQRFSRCGSPRALRPPRFTG